MGAILYTVRVTVPSEKIAADYVEWLRGGHTQAICKYADRAHVYRVDTSDQSIQLDARYDFRDRATFDRYIQGGAPKLRAEALEKFGPSTGVKFERWTEELVFETGKN